MRDENKTARNFALHGRDKSFEMSRGNRNNASQRSVTPLAWVIPNATVFVSSGCIMVIELVAGRMIARHLGSSIYTWTSVIGVVLAGIAMGNYIGGWLADRYRSKRTLTLLFMISSLTAATITLINSTVGGWLWLGDFSWQTRAWLRMWRSSFFCLPQCWA